MSATCRPANYYDVIVYAAAQDGSLAIKTLNYNGISSRVVDIIIVDNTSVLVGDDMEFYLYIGTLVRARYAI